MIVGFTGHRKISGLLWIDRLESTLKGLNPEKCINGMAIGFDHMAAFTCIRLEIPFIAAIPCDNQDKKWNMADKLNYEYLLNKAVEIVQVCEGGYAAWKMFKRDEYIVDNSDIIIAYYDGRDYGGTYHTIEYAKNKGKEVLNIYR